MARRKSTGLLADSGERHDYALTEDEWRALGGTPAPDYDEMMDHVESGRGWRTGRAGWQHMFQGPQGVPADDDTTAAKFQAIAKRLGVHMLTIRWPDVHYPDITAVPK